MNRLGLGLAVGAGYVLGRTKKMKLAFAVGTMVAGKRMHLSPRALADLVSGQLQNNPQFKEIGEQLREDLHGVGKAASGALVERRMEGLADRLHGRTAQVKDQLSGVVPDVPGPDGDDGEENQADEPDDEYDEYDSDEPDDSGRDERGSDDDEEPASAEDEERPRRRKKAPPKKAAEKRSPAKKAPAKKTTAARKTAARPGKKASAKKTASARSAARRAAGNRPSKGGGDDD